MEKENAEKDHLIHCITNPISMSRCADTILALGGRPIMAEHPDEVAEITATASSLLLNLGNISDVRMSSMKISLKEANGRDIPVVLDAVGVSCSNLRRRFLRELIQTGKFTVIKGNYSEILAIYDDTYKGIGVDAQNGIEEDVISRAAMAIAKENKTTVVATGKEDIVCDGERLVRVEGGCEQMSSVTGTGCMLGAVIATFIAEDISTDKVIKACTFFKRCGLKAKTDKGSGTYMVNLIDALGERDDT